MCDTLRLGLVKAKAMEDRQTYRISTNLQVFLKSEQIAVTNCQIVNISPNGLFVNNCNRVFPANTQLKLTFDYNLSETCTLLVIVVHTKNYGMGMKFSNISTALEKYAHVLLGNLVHLTPINQNPLNRQNAILHSASDPQK